MYSPKGEGGRGRGRDGANDPCETPILAARQYTKRFLSSTRSINSLNTSTQIITMNRLQSSPRSLPHLLFFLCTLALIAPSQALYFFLEGGTTKCFYEELPKDTLVVGEPHPYFSIPNSTT
jgi:hypothetical protein